MRCGSKGYLPQQSQLLLSRGEHACVWSRKGLGGDAAIRQFLALSSDARASDADRAGPSAMDIRELRSLSLSIPSLSAVGLPIAVSLPDSDLSALKRFLRGSVGGSVSSAGTKVRRKTTLRGALC